MGKFNRYPLVDLNVRPVYHRLDPRVRAHLFVCMLAYHVEYEMRERLAPLLFDDEQQKALSVQPAEKSRSAKRRAQRGTNAAGDPVHSFHTLIDDLATVARKRIRPMKRKRAEYWMITTPTKEQQKVLDLLGVKLNIG